FPRIIRKKQSGSASHFFRKSLRNQKNVSKQQEEAEGKNPAFARSEDGTMPNRSHLCATFVNVFAVFLGAEISSVIPAKE
ncbi:hypothetical protein BDFB_005592, partial [Asbolus verrucosus]